MKDKLQKDTFRCPFHLSEASRGVDSTFTRTVVKVLCNRTSLSLLAAGFRGTDRQLSPVFKRSLQCDASLSHRTEAAATENL